MATVAAQAARGNMRTYTGKAAVQDIDDEIDDDDDDAQPPNETIPTKPSKRADLDVPPVSDETIRGQTRFDKAGRMFYRKDNNSTWEPAVFHDYIRARLLAETDRLGTYDHPRAKGTNPLDRTSYLASQKTWGFKSRQQWPDILHTIFPPDERSGSRPEIWYDRGRVVLDPDSHPVKLWKDIPLVCAEVMEGGLMESIRRTDPNITHKDFRARMPHSQGREGYTRPLCVVTALSNRQWRFRIRTGCLSWDTRAGSASIRHYMASLYPASCLEANSSKGFRNLTKQEFDEIVLLNKGKFPERGRVTAKIPMDRAPGHIVVDPSGTPVVKAGNKRKRATTPPCHKPVIDALADVEYDGDTIVVGVGIDNHEVLHRQKRARRGQEHNDMQNQNTLDEQFNSNPSHFEGSGRIARSIVSGDINHGLAVHRNSQPDSMNGRPIARSNRDRDSLASHTHRQRNRQEGSPTAMHLHWGAGHYRSKSSIRSPSEYHQEHSPYSQPSEDQSSWPYVHDSSRDGPSTSLQHAGRSYYTEQLPSPPQPLIRPLDSQNTEYHSAIIAEDTGNRARINYEKETLLSLIDPQLLELSVPSPPHSWAPVPRIRATNSRMPSGQNPPHTLSIEAYTAVAQSSHRSLPALAHSSSANIHDVPAAYDPHNDDPIDFQESAEDSALWLARNLIFF